eukprot:TRINITY_DN10722_c0_g1_i1.p1 TRINITY_DN10722_c0_g1~~TRINITY_DN10722_c0_g1_i1.p1  ORF type:complete len:898 (+),score=230.69 TRINITY_DN10722_c0_g1_i1:1815-4508(+)
MSIRDEGSSDKSSSEDGLDLDDLDLLRADAAEAAGDTWEAGSMLADEDASSSEGRSINTDVQNEYDKRLHLRERGAKRAAIDRVRSFDPAAIEDDLTSILSGESHRTKSQFTHDRNSQATGTLRTTTLKQHNKQNADDEDSFDSTSSSSSSSDGEQVDLCDIRGVPSEFIKKENVMREVRKQFRNFLRKQPDDHGVPLYPQKMKQIVQNQAESLIVDFQELSRFKYGLAVLSGEVPSVILKVFDEVASRELFRAFPAYSKVFTTIHVRLVNLPTSDAIRELRAIHMNMLTMVHGVVTRRSLVYPQLKAVKFDCLSCGYTIGPLAQNGSQEAKIKQCPSCQRPGPFRLNSSQTHYRNYQTVILQETPGTVPPGRLPRWIEVILVDDLVDIARPGDEIQVTGIYRNHFDPLLNHKQGFPVFTTVLEANAVRRRVDDLQESMTEDEKKEIKRLSQHPNIVDKIIASICPSIHGNEMVKAGIACSLFGGVRKEAKGGHKLRGDINVLLVGDPGCAKSQFLKYVEKTSPRSVFTTGKGSTAVGLTAAVHKDSMTGEWTLEGGAMVIADQGHCLIDEFDKMSDQDRTSIHEAMEQQTISIAKAGIVTSLQARCSIVAAANPIMGHYDSTVTFENQVNLTQPILSRFDLLFAIRDTVDPIKDTQLARFVLNSHMRSHPLGDGTNLLDGVPEVKEDMDPASPNPLPQKVLQEYILYARTHVSPKLEQVDLDRLVKFYVDLRDDSAMKHESGVKIVVRHLESVVRLATSFAKMRLSSYVREDDVSRAIALFLNAFLSTLQYKRREALRKKYTSYLVLDKQHFQILSHILAAGVKEQCQLMSLKYGGYEGRDIIQSVADLQSKATEHKIFEQDVGKYFKTNAFAANYRLINNGQDILWVKGATTEGS